METFCHQSKGPAAWDLTLWRADFSLLRVHIHENWLWIFCHLQKSSYTRPRIMSPLLTLGYEAWFQGRISTKFQFQRTNQCKVWTVLTMEHLKSKHTNHIDVWSILLMLQMTWSNGIHQCPRKQWLHHQLFIQQQALSAGQANTSLHNNTIDGLANSLQCSRFSS